MNKVDILLLSEITAINYDVFWLQSEDRRTLIVRSRKTAIVLIGICTDLWIESGIQIQRTDRTTTIRVKNYGLISVYQPLWHYGRKTIMNYRHAIVKQIALKRYDKWLAIGRNHDASVAKLEQRSTSTKARGKYGFGACNEAGRDLIPLREMNGMTWANSFIIHPDRGTWSHQRYGRWYELDGFLIQQEQRHQIVQNMQTVKENSFSDHRQKELITMTVTRSRLVTTGNRKLSINHIVLKKPEK